MFNRVLIEGDENPNDECFRLFKLLKQTVEWLLAGYSPNVWNTYGSLPRLCSIIDEIFSHGLLYEGPQKYVEFLSVTAPSFVVKADAEMKKNCDISNSDRQFCFQWLENSLLEHNLSSQLQLLLQDEVYLSRYYKKTAFLRNKPCVNALLICLRAVEQNQPVLLTELDPSLVMKTYVQKKNTLNVPIEIPTAQNYDVCDNKEIFDASSSLDYLTPPELPSDAAILNQLPFQDINGNPSNFISENLNQPESEIPLKFSNFVKSDENVTRTESISDFNSSKSESLPQTASQRSSVSDWQVISNSFSANDLSTNLQNNLELPTSVGENVTMKISSWKAQHSRSKSDGTTLLGPLDEDETNDTNFFSSLPSILSEEEKQKKKSIFEGDQVLASTECFFPRPQPGQTLTSFLKSKDFNICAELDKENAHFFIAEALISAIEQIKCAQSARYVAEEVESDEEIKTLTQRIRIRRREKMREKEIKSLALLSDGKTDTTSQSVSPKSSTHSSDFEAGESIGSEDEIEDIEISEHTDSNLTSVKETGLSLSMASLYSDADIKKAAMSHSHMNLNDKKSSSENNATHLSAEAIALSLLKRFSEKQLPKASELQWLVSEEDAKGQQLLPLPDSWPVSPDSVFEEYGMEKIRLRGNLEWAPPRRQIIFTIHPAPKRKIAIQNQNYQCRGCGMKIEKSYAKKFRYCDYLGQFFCQCCHSNDVYLIPARILWKWDFKKYYVSKFAYQVLDQMFYDPLFDVLDNNPDLYRKVRQLDMCREYRTQLFYLKDFIKTCRKADDIQSELNAQPQYILNNQHLYSIHNFIEVKNGNFPRFLSALVSRCLTHVTKCILCQAKGFICEMCDKNKDIIYPFQLSKVVHCLVCGSCFHKKCYKAGVCPKCNRIKARKKKLLDLESNCVC